MYPFPATPEYKSDVFSSYHVFSQISYYSLISPYRTSIASDSLGNPTLKMRRNKFQQILCGFLHFWIVVLSVLGAILAIYGERPSIKYNPTLVYDIAKALSFCLGNLLFIFMIRIKKDGLLDLYVFCFEMAPPLKPVSLKVSNIVLLMHVP